MQKVTPHLGPGHSTECQKSRKKQAFQELYRVTEIFFYLWSQAIIKNTAFRQIRLIISTSSVFPETDFQHYFCYVSLLIIGTQANMKKQTRRNENIPKCWPRPTPTSSLPVSRCHCTLYAAEGRVRISHLHAIFASPKRPRSRPRIRLCPILPRKPDMCISQLKITDIALATKLIVSNYLPASAAGSVI